MGTTGTKPARPNPRTELPSTGCCSESTPMPTVSALPNNCPTRAAAAVAELEHWAIGFLADQSGRAPGGVPSRQVSYVVHHFSPGG